MSRATVERPDRRILEEVGRTDPTRPVGHKGYPNNGRFTFDPPYAEAHNPV